MAEFKVAIVIPAFNEENTISNIINEVVHYGIVIVVDDGSTDNTAQIARSAGASVVTHSVNRGYDAALNSGFRKAGMLNCDVILTFDADGQHPPSLIKQFVSEIEAGADVVIGVRNSFGRFMENIFSMISTKLWGISDPQCGMKAYKYEVYKKLGHFDSYGSIGTELCIFAARQGYKIFQIPFEVTERVDKPRFGRLFLANWKIFRAIIIAVFVNEKLFK